MNTRLISPPYFAFPLEHKNNSSLSKSKQSFKVITLFLSYSQNFKIKIIFSSFQTSRYAWFRDLRDEPTEIERYGPSKPSPHVRLTKLLRDRSQSRTSTCFASSCSPRAATWCTAPRSASSVCGRASPWRSSAPSWSCAAPGTPRASCARPRRWWAAGRSNR